MTIWKTDNRFFKPYFNTFLLARITKIYIKEVIPRLKLIVNMFLSSFIDGKPLNLIIFCWRIVLQNIYLATFYAMLLITFCRVLLDFFKKFFNMFGKMYGQSDNW